MPADNSRYPSDFLTSTRCVVKAGNLSLLFVSVISEPWRRVLGGQWNSHTVYCMPIFLVCVCVSDLYLTRCPSPANDVGSVCLTT